MLTRDQWREFRQSKPVRTASFVAGLLLMLLALPVGALPGPGGIFVFAAGLALTLRNSDWAKRQYVRFKRWQPKAGHWMDWGLRRRSHRRREERRKARAVAKQAKAISEAEMAALIPDLPGQTVDQWKDKHGSKN
ncbi:MAG: hypothetical protein ABIO43_01420 [Sphingomicrobium sp.]